MQGTVGLRDGVCRIAVVAGLLLPLIISLGCSDGGGEKPGPAANTFEAVEIGPEGGEFSLDNGITLSVPAGAVTETTTFQFRVVLESEVELPTTFFRTFDTRLLAGFAARPAGYEFAAPVEVGLPSAGLSDGSSLPFPLELNLETHELSLIGEGSPATLGRLSARDALTMVEVGPDGTITIKDLSHLPADERATVIAEIKKVLENSDCVADPCRCGRIVVKSEDFDSTGKDKDECYSVHSDGYVQYLDCEYQPVEPWSLHEGDKDVTVVPNDATIAVEEIVYFSVAMTDSAGKGVVGYKVIEVSIEDLAVISELSHGLDNVAIEGEGVGVSAAEVTTQAGECKYRGQLTVEVEGSEIVVSPDRMAIPEGEARAFGVKLSERPGAHEAIIVTALVGGDESLVLASGDTLTFDIHNWDVLQQLVIAAEDDADPDNGTGTVGLLAMPDRYAAATVDVTAIDDDSPNLVVNRSEVTVPEASHGSFLVRLNGSPDAPIIVNVDRKSGDSDITVASALPLVFDDANWNTHQRVVLHAAVDADTENGSTLFELTDVDDSVAPWLVWATEEEIPPHESILIIEGAEDNYYGGWSSWWGSAPITFTVDPATPCRHLAVGSGQGGFTNAYSYQVNSWPHGLITCYVQETGTIGIEVDGWSDCSDPPKITLNTRLTKDTLEEEWCPDYWAESNTGFFTMHGGGQDFLKGANDYVLTYEEEGLYMRWELLNPPE